MAKQTFSVGQVLTAAQMTSLQQTAMGGGSPSVKTTSYVLVAADAGTVIQVNSTSATTVTVNTGLFSAGDSVQIQNIGSGTTTITAGSATVNSAGSLAVTQYDGGFLYFSSASSAIWFDYTQAGTTFPLTTKGDLYTYSTTGARLAVGTNGQTLVADSAEATGLKWATASSGGLTLISETVASANSSINLTSIPGTYKQLLLVWSGLYPSGTGSVFSIRFNNDSTAGIYQGMLTPISAPAVFDSNAADDGSNGGLFGYNSVSTSTLYYRQVQGVLLIDNYASTSKYKFYNGNGSWVQGSTAYVPKVNGVYKSTSAITSLDIIRLSGSDTLSNATSTSVRLYGLS